MSRKQKILVEEQAGFRKNRSKQMVIFKLTETTKNDFKSGQKNGIVL